MLTNTAYVILGFLQNGPMSGYDIKAKVDISTRFFFAASYGQIYPELKRLESRGLIAGTDKRNGGRSRTEYVLTASGRKALAAWLTSNGSGIEMRDEGILKLFFIDDLGDGALLDRVRDLRAERVAGLTRLHEIDVEKPDELESSMGEVLAYGIGLHQYVIEWCDELEAKILRRSKQPKQSSQKVSKQKAG